MKIYEIELQHRDSKGNEWVKSYELYTSLAKATKRVGDYGLKYRQEQEVGKFIERDELYIDNGELVRRLFFITQKATKTKREEYVEKKFVLKEREVIE